MKEYIKKEKKGTFKLLLRVILHPCERKYYYQLVTRMKQFLSHGDCHASQSNGPSCNVSV